MKVIEWPTYFSKNHATFSFLRVNTSYISCLVIHMTCKSQLSSVCAFVYYDITIILLVWDDIPFLTYLQYDKQNVSSHFSIDSDLSYSSLHELFYIGWFRNIIDLDPILILQMCTLMFHSIYILCLNRKTSLNIHVVQPPIDSV